MFKYYLNLNNEFSYNNQYELHKKNCPIVKQTLGSGNDDLFDLGFFETTSKAVVGAKELLASRDCDPNLLNGCLACMKEMHKR